MQVDLSHVGALEDEVIAGAHGTLRGFTSRRKQLRHLPGASGILEDVGEGLRWFRQYQHVLALCIKRDVAVHKESCTKHSVLGGLELRRLGS